MDFAIIVLIIGGLVVLSTAVGFVITSREGRLTRPTGITVIDHKDLPGASAFGKRATLLQFSSEFCTKCPATRVLLSRIASETPGVEHVDIDLTHSPEIAQKYNILQTPTTFVLDDVGAVAARIGGSPRPDALKTALQIALRREHDSYII
jgi:thiol-disulfide isomerase/thioredoxin